MIITYFPNWSFVLPLICIVHGFPYTRALTNQCTYVRKTNGNTGTETPFGINFPYGPAEIGFYLPCGNFSYVESKNVYSFLIFKRPSYDNQFHLCISNIQSLNRFLTSTCHSMQIKTTCHGKHTYVTYFIIRKRQTINNKENNKKNH